MYGGWVVFARPPPPRLSLSETRREWCFWCRGLRPPGVKVFYDLCAGPVRLAVGSVIPLPVQSSEPTNDNGAYCWCRHDHFESLVLLDLGVYSP